MVMLGKIFFYFLGQWGIHFSFFPKKKIKPFGQKKNKQNPQLLNPKF